MQFHKSKFRTLARALHFALGLAYAGAATTVQM